MPLVWEYPVPSDWKSVSLWTHAFCSRAWKGLDREPPLRLNREPVLWHWPVSPGKNRRWPTWSLDPHAEQTDGAEYGRGPCDPARLYPSTLVSLTALHPTGLHSADPTWQLSVHLKAFTWSLSNSRRASSPFFSPRLSFHPS